MHLRQRRQSRQMLRQIHQRLLKFAAQQTLDSRRPQTFRSQRRVKSVRAQMRLRIPRANRFDQLQRQPRRRVHRHVKRNQPRVSRCLFPQRLPRQIQARHFMPAFPQPRRRRSQPKRLPSQFIRRNQQYLHDASL